MKSKSLIRQTIFDSCIFAYLLIVAAVVFIAADSEAEQLELASRWGWLLIFLFSGGVLSIFFHKANQVSLGSLIFRAAGQGANQPERSWFKTVWGWQLSIFVIVTFWLGIKFTQFSFSELLDEDGFRGAIRLFSGILHPNLSLLPRALLGMVETVFTAFLATLLAIPVAFVLSFFCAKNVMRSAPEVLVYAVLRTLLNATRSVEALIWAIIFSVWVGIGPFAGMLALFLHSIASLTKQYSELIESVNEGPIESIQSTGATRLQTIWFGIVPQVFLPFISFTIYRWDINIRMATIIGLVGGGGIGTLLMRYQGQAMWSEVGCIILVVAVVVWLMDTASAYLREALK